MQYLQLFGFGLLGILIISLIKCNDLNKVNPNTTFKKVVAQFLNREWPSYGLSIVIIITTSLTSDEWMNILKSGKLPLDQIWSAIGGYVKLSMVAWGAIGQYLIYKWLGKMGKELVVLPPTNGN